MKVDVNVILNLSCSEKVDSGKEENVLVSIGNSEDYCVVGIIIAFNCNGYSITSL